MALIPNKHGIKDDKKMNRNETRTNAQLNLKYEISFNERTYTRTLKI